MSSLKPCPYAEKCYRRNPIHFREFSHQHLDTIFEKGRDPITEEYSIPINLHSNIETLKDQLNLLEKLHPKETDKNSKVKKESYSRNKELDKKRKDEDKFTSSSSSSTKKVKLCSKEKRREEEINRNKENNNQIVRKMEDYINVVAPKGQMAEKLKMATPYNIFFTSITSSPRTHKQPLTITFQEIFDASLGEIESTVQINFMVDIGWLLGHYYFAKISNLPLLVIYGSETEELTTISKFKPNVTAIHVQLPAFSTAHSKIMIISYTDGSMRIIISTANLYEDDWENRTQGLWMSPCLPPLSSADDTKAGESCTNFRQDFVNYLSAYKIPKLESYIARILRTDFSAIKVFFIGSVHGNHREDLNGNYPWGHPKVGNILSRHSTVINDRIPLVCQSSSIGFLGPNVGAWIESNILASMRKDTCKKGIRRLPPFKMIYPSLENVRNSHDGMLGGGCLPYSKATNDRQFWLKDYLHQWKSSVLFRSQAMPHIKSYTRYNLNDQNIYWFLLTSANLSKAAWGQYTKTIQPSLRILNYEAGVLFMPRVMLGEGEDTFPLGHDRNNIPAFPLPYDVPLTPYSADDKPFLSDYLCFDEN